jgi:GT2 family glycosyltransferase
MPPVYVAILAYNDRTYLPQFLSSVLATNYPNLVVWVIDNGSAPPLRALLEAPYSEAIRAGRLRLLRYEENTGYAGGYQRFFTEHGVDVPYLALLNSDVEVTPDWLAPLIQRLEADPQLAAIQPKIRAYHQRDYFEYAGGAGGLLDPWGYPTCRGRRGFSMERDEGQYDDSILIFWASGAAFVVRTAAIREALRGLLFKSHYFMHMEEIDLCWRLQRAGYAIGYEPQSLVYHVGGASLSQSHPQKTFYNFRNNLFLLVENLYPAERWLIFLAIGAGWCGGYLFSSFWAGPAYLGYYSGAWGGLSGVGARRAAERAVFTLSTAQGPARAHPHAYPPEAHKDRPKGARLRALACMSAFFFYLCPLNLNHMSL